MNADIRLKMFYCHSHSVIIFYLYGLYTAHVTPSFTNKGKFILNLRYLEKKPNIIQGKEEQRSIFGAQLKKQTPSFFYMLLTLNLWIKVYSEIDRKCVCFIKIRISGRAADLLLHVIRILINQTLSQPAQVTEKYPSLTSLKTRKLC